MAVTYVYPSLKNLDASGAVTISNVNWSGSYNPQIALLINPNGWSQGQLKTVQTSGYSSLDFRASITKEGVTRTCAFSLSVNNSTGTIASAQAIRWTGLALCDVQQNGNNIDFFMKFDPNEA